MKVVRAAGVNVSPSDDGRLFNQIFSDGLFEDTTITISGTTQIALGAMYGVMRGRDFTVESMTIDPTLPADANNTTGYVYVEFDTTATPIISIKTALSPFTPTYEDINTNGAVCQMIIAEYVANSVAISSVTPTYTLTSGGIGAGNIATIEVSPASANHAVGDYIVYGGRLYKVTTAITAGDALTVGTNITASVLTDDITNLTAVVTGTLSSSAGFSSYVSYPTGFTYDNCSVAMVSVQMTVNGNTWRNGHGTTAASKPERFFVDNDATGIRVFNDNSAIYSSTFKVLLVKN